MGGPAIYTELVGFFWTASEIVMYQYCICRQRKEFSWLKIFVFLNQTNIEGILV